MILNSSKNLLLDTKIPKEIKEIIDIVGDLADETKLPCYIVGGFVRDLIIGGPLKSLDILIVGDSLFFAERLSEKLSLDCIFHPRFKTATILKDGIRIDIATSRSELYKHPGALPIVKKGDLEEDLKRRDFTINTLLISLNKNNKGSLIDLHQGFSDIKNKKIKILHPNSFIDDPTRILRAIRFEVRLGFKMDRKTERLAKSAIKDGYLGRISRTRIRNELLLILQEENPEKCLLRLYRLGGLKFIYPGLCIEREKFLKVKEVLSSISWKIDRVFLNLLVLIDRLDIEEAEKFFFELKFERKIRESALKIKKDKEILLFLRRKALKNSMIYERLNKIPEEGLIFIMSKTKSKETRKRILEFLSFRKTKIFLTGDDLKRLGFKPGPIYKKILKELFYLKLDGKVKTKDDELEFLKYILNTN